MRSRIPFHGRSRGSPGGYTLVEVCVIIALIVVLFGAVLPLLTSRSHEGSGRVRCASNLRQIGQGIQMYANENKGNFPRALYDGVGGPPTEYTASGAPNPLAPGGPGPNDVTAALFLLLRTQDLTPEVFVCPQSQGECWAFNGKTAQQVSNFPGGQYLTYSYINPYPTEAARKDGFKLDFTLTSDFAIAADINPGGQSVVSVTPHLSRRETSAANSNNHLGDGQNVLYADGHVEFQHTPFCGMQRGTAPDGHRDNIYTCGAGYGTGPEGAGVAVKGPPADALDSILLPVDVFPRSGTGGALPGPRTASHFVVMGVATVFGAIVVVATLVRRSGLATPPPPDAPPPPPATAT
jgi:prepilin-type processing-associated H-X9-DG protein